MKNSQWLSIASIILLLSACTNDELTSEFKLPSGDAINGQVVFVEMQCIECHTLSGADYIDDLQEMLNELGMSQRKLSIEIGDDNTRVKTHAELVTSIINPSHKLAKGYQREQIAVGNESKMPNYNDILTVDELIDLVEFLHAHYELQSVPLAIYPHYQVQ